MPGWEYLLPDNIDDPELDGVHGLVAAVVYQALRDALQGFHPALRLAACLWLLKKAPALMEPFGIRADYFLACLRAVLPDELLNEADSLPAYKESILLALTGDDEPLVATWELLHG